MKITSTLQSILFFSIVTLYSTAISAQTGYDLRLLGQWAFERYEFLETSSDTSAMKKESKGIILSFEKGKKFTTKKKQGSVETIVGTGTYNISDDGKYLYQNGEEAEIILLDEKELVFKVPGTVIIHLRRLK